jgi:hypothetical protein
LEDPGIDVTVLLKWMLTGIGYEREKWIQLLEVEVFRVVTPFNVVMYQRFRVLCCLHLHWVVAPCCVVLCCVVVGYQEKLHNLYPPPSTVPIFETRWIIMGLQYHTLEARNA